MKPYSDQLKNLTELSELAKKNGTTIIMSKQNPKGKKRLTPVIKRLKNVSCSLVGAGEVVTLKDAINIARHAARTGYREGFEDASLQVGDFREASVRAIMEGEPVFKNGRWIVPGGGK